MKILQIIYKVARSVLFTAIIFVAALYLIIYILLSVPALQNRIKEVARVEASAFLGGDVQIEGLTIRPFNEVVVSGLSVFDPEGERCLRVETVGAGINIWRLITSREIELTYGEIIGLDARIFQQVENGPLNIQFIIDALKPKDKNKPPSKFDLKLRNVVLRRCKASFDREWKPKAEGEYRTDFNHVAIEDLRADVAFPRLSNNDFEIDLRRMSFMASGGLDIEKIAFKASLTDELLSVRNLVVAFPGTELRPSDITLPLDGLNTIPQALKNGAHTVVITDNKVSLPDFGWLVPQLRNFTETLSLNLEATGGMSDVKLSRLGIDGGDEFMFELSGDVSGLQNPSSLEFTADNLRLKASPALVSKIMDIIPALSPKVKGILHNCGDINLSATGRGAVGKGDYEADCELSVSCGSLFVSGECKNLKSYSGIIKAEATSESFQLGALLGEEKIGSAQFDVVFDGMLARKDVDGTLSAYVTEFVYNGVQCGGVALDAIKEGEDVEAHVTIDNAVASAEAELKAAVNKENPWLNLQCEINEIVPSMFLHMPKFEGYSMSATVSADVMGNNIDNLIGELRLSDARFSKDGGNEIELDKFMVKASDSESGRTLSIESDWLDAEVEGNYKYADIPRELMGMVSQVVPSLVKTPDIDVQSHSDVEFSLLVRPDNSLPEFLNLPFRFLVPVSVHGNVCGTDSTSFLAVDIPYIQQGRNKLVRDSRLNINLDGRSGTMGLELASTFPAKKGDVALDLRMWGKDDDVFADVGWQNPDNSSFKGVLSLGAKLSRDELTSKPEVRVDISPSVFDMGAARWNIDKGSIAYDDNAIEVKGVKIWHNNQFVEIEGVASSLPADSISVRLADIDVGYIFDTLKINYVTFGGIATGEVKGIGVLGPDPHAATENLFIKDLSYNGAVLGDGVLKSRWDNDQKEVTINADIARNGRRTALIDGGVWVTRDSLSFEVEADKVSVEFLKPFMSAFTSDVKGRASGNAKLFGTFSDIDLTGKLLADSLAIKLDYTNTYYHGTDSVFLYPGRIEIPSFRLYDRSGHSAILSGELTHRYFHDPHFTFRVSDARHLLCYDTNAKMNPDWYGTLFGDGSAIVRGWPGTVNVSVDMTIVGDSRFTFVLNDTQAAEDYHFLTFSDKKKEEAERLKADTVPDPLAAFRKKIESTSQAPSKFGIDIRASVNPSALLTLVMDPVAGDKITARGNGAIQVDYETDTDEMQMFGKYTLDEGNYNFSLQDLILRDFKIRQGSSISFNGDPLNANLDIAASYRANTNLSDLDKSFATDRELARTNVPVDAILMVKGEMTHPDITFDIELPTLTQDVVRKVKSIISTDDMMSRQIIYLLALNRFYTPEYMGASGNGGELAAVASTTLSSQLSNMIGQLTDKFTVAPTFRSDKGDFSDLEFDVALSSRLLNNRLLVNGNFGYRDRSTSQTTFVGDFDIEYLLSRNGNLRLKAYNHFNDQNYYLRQALTTQGLGVVYRRDFDNPFSFLRRKKKNAADSVKNVIESVNAKKEEEEDAAGNE